MIRCPLAFIQGDMRLAKHGPRELGHSSAIARGQHHAHCGQLRWRIDEIQRTSRTNAVFD